MHKNIFIICIIFCFIFFNQAQADQSQQERELAQNIEELIKTNEERGREIYKFIDLGEPAERIRLTEQTEKAVEIMNALDMTANVLQVPVLSKLTPGIVTIIGWGAQTAARALDLTDMLAELGHRQSLRAYIQDRPKFNSSEEAFEVAMKIIKQEFLGQDVADGYKFPGGQLDVFYVTVTGQGAGAFFKNAAKKISGTRNPTTADYENLLKVYEFDYQCYKLATDKDYRQKIENALSGKVDRDLPGGEKIAFYSILPQSDNTATMSVNFIDPDGTGLIKIDDIVTLEENSGLSELSWAPDGSMVSFMYTKNRYPQYDNGKEYLHPVLFYLINADGSGTRKFEIPFTYDINGWSGLSTPIWSPNGHKIAFSIEPIRSKKNCSPRDGIMYNSLYVINSDGTKLKQLADTLHSSRFQDFSWSPDGEKISFTGCTKTCCRINIINADGTSLNELTGYEGKYDRRPIWSPIDDKIAFISRPIDKYSPDGKKNIDRVDRIDVINADGTERIPLTEVKYGHIDDIAWSPDGQNLAYSASHNGIPRISVVKADGTGRVRLTDDLIEYINWFSWSPDGGKIIARLKRDGNYGIYLLSIEKTEKYIFADDFFTNTMDYSWCSDGEKIAFRFESDSDASIYTIKTDGTELTKLTDEKGVDIMPAWSP